MQLRQNICYLTTAALLSVLFSGYLFAIENELRQVRTLAERGHFEAVEALCQETFDQPNITEIDKVRLATELVYARSLQLLIATPARQNQIVSGLKTLETTRLVVSANSAAPELALARITLRLQLAMVFLVLGDDQRLEADIASTTTQRAAYQKARSTLQDALDRLKTSRQELQALRQRIGTNAVPPLQQRVLALEYSLTMQQGIAQKSQALTFSDEADRKFELQQAAGTLSELASLNSIDPVIVQCKIEKAACHRLGGELDRCAEIVSPLLNAAASLSLECRLRTEAEWIRYHIASGNNIAELRRQYPANRDIERLHPDFDLARLELLLVNAPDRNIRTEHAAVNLLRQKMERELTGTPWGRRAGLIVSARTLGSTDLASAEMLATLAETRFQENQFTEAANYYEQAAERADANRQADNMYRFNRFAISALFKAMEHASDESKGEYRDRLVALLRKLSMQFPDHPEAVDLHLAAIDLQRSVALTQPELRNDYLELIQEHTETWKESPQLQPLRRLTVILLERQGRIDEAAVLLPLLNVEQLETLPPEIRRLRVRQLDAEGKTQEAVNISTALLEQGREPATLQLLAEILSRQTDAKSLNEALNYWAELEQKAAKESEPWWCAREGILDVLLKLGRQDEAKREFAVLRVLRPELGGAERKERLVKRFEGM